MGDRIKVKIFGDSEKLKRLTPQRKPIIHEMKFNIIFENENILVIDKPAGISMHPGTGIQIVTIIEGLMGYGKQNGFKPFLVHRLDKHTSGVLITAKNPEWARKITKIFKDHNLEKKYIALVNGRSDFMNYKIFTKNDDGFIEKSIVTTIKNFKESSLVEIKLLTGKKHQIRRQLAGLNFPIIGDNHYGNESINKSYKKSVGLKRYFLHCSYISFKDPVSDEKLIFESPLPEDLEKILNKLDEN
ncbi:MAG: rRNA pseudouridine synthase [Kosmotogales bacterium]|nr:rRNA pseudouridine synthase [Kosmotogales bacterium]